MSQFIDTPALYKQYASENAPNIFSIGYNDFTVVAPLKCYRIQEFWTLHLVLSGRGICGSTSRRSPSGGISGKAAILRWCPPTT